MNFNVSDELVQIAMPQICSVVVAAPKVLATMALVNAGLALVASNATNKYL